MPRSDHRTWHPTKHAFPQWHYYTESVRFQVFHVRRAPLMVFIFICIIPGLTPQFHNRSSHVIRTLPDPSSVLYKTNWDGRRVIDSDRTLATSRGCCGVVAEMRLAARRWVRYSPFFHL